MPPDFHLRIFVLKSTAEYRKIYEMAHEDEDVYYKIIFYIYNTRVAL